MRFQIIGNQISRTDKEIVTTRNVNYITCTFDFDESYRDLSLYAVFYRNEEQNFVVDVTNGECLFPWELLETAGVIYVGAYGVKGSTDTLEKRATTNAVVIRVVDSLSSDNLPELTPTPDVWEQYRAEVLGYRDATKLYTAQAETYATEAEGNAVTAVRSASQANASALLADESAVQAEQAAASTTVNAKEATLAAENAKESADQALLYRNQAEEIKNSVRIEYDVQPTKIGIKQGDETEFTYTDDLTGPRGEKGDKGDSSGVPMITPSIVQADSSWAFSITSDELKGEVGELFIMFTPSNPPAASIIINGKAFFCELTEWLTDTAYLMLVENDWMIRVVGYRTGASITVDAALSETSENPVQNKVITKALYTAGEALETLGQEVENLKENGGSGVSSWNDLTDKPFYTEEVWKELISETALHFNLNDGMSVFMAPATTEMLEMYNSEWGKALVLWDGVEYECQPKMFNGMLKAVGNVEAVEGTGDSGEPFAMLIDSDGLIMGTPIAMVVSITDTINGTESSTHTVGVSLFTESIHPLDPKFIDDVSWNKISDKPFGEFPSGTVIADEDVVFISELNPLGVDLENFIEGVQYTITINDDTYTETAYKDTDSGYVQICVMQEGAEIFTFVSPHSVFMSDTLTVGETYRIKIAFAEDYVKPIDSKYLPSGLSSGLPEITTDDNGKLLQVVDGVWTAVTIANGNEVAY